MLISPMGSRSEPSRYGEWPTSPSTLPAPSGSTSSPNGHSYQYQDGPAQQPRSRFTLSPIAGHTIPPHQQQEGHIQAPRMRHDQPGIGSHPFPYAEGGMHAPYEHTQTVRPHPRHDQASSSVHNNNERVFSQNTGHSSFGGSSNDDIGYLNEGKDDSAGHWHAIRTVCGGRSYGRLEAVLLTFLLTLLYRFYISVVALLRIEIMEWSPAKQ
jgi:hypothetical protein